MGRNTNRHLKQRQKLQQLAKQRKKDAKQKKRESSK
jgi:hypothetical protein